MSVQRDVDDPERIGPVRHPDDCDCDTCNPPQCPGCGDELPDDFTSFCAACDEARSERFDDVFDPGAR